jgi:hypothetical protein
MVKSCPAYGRPCRLPDAGPPADGGGLHWVYTCGYPVCRVPPVGAAPPPLVDDAGAACAPLGAACSTRGETCGTPSDNNCGRIEACEQNAPIACPRSSAKFKNDIHYVDESQLAELHEETMRVRLATYNYKGQYGDPDVKHLGFIIEDNPQSFAVDRGHDRVDIYGYLSMVVAAMQVQEKQIEELRQELQHTRGAVCGANQSPRP